MPVKPYLPKCFIIAKNYRVLKQVMAKRKAQIRFIIAKNYRVLKLIKDSLIAEASFIIAKNYRVLKRYG